MDRGCGRIEVDGDKVFMKKVNGRWVKEGEEVLEVDGE